MNVPFERFFTWLSLECNLHTRAREREMWQRFFNYYIQMNSIFHFNFMLTLSLCVWWSPWCCVLFHFPSIVCMCVSFVYESERKIEIEIDSVSQLIYKCGYCLFICRFLSAGSASSSYTWHICTMHRNRQSRLGIFPFRSYAGNSAAILEKWREHGMYITRYIVGVCVCYCSSI